MISHPRRSTVPLSRIRRTMLTGLAVLAATAVASGVVPTGGGGLPQPTAAAAAPRPFAADSPWNRPIPARPALDPLSSRWVRYLSAAGPQSALLEDTGVPVYVADAQTPRHRVTCTRNYGRCPAAPVPIPLGARPASGADGAMVVIDRSTGRHHDFWQLRREGGRWVCSWCDSGPLSGDGRDSQTVGAGVSRLAGVIRAEEIRAGRIDHALVFASAMTAPGVFRYPARKTDGRNVAGVAVPLPAGARIQLDPSIDVERIPGITRAEKIVARALQKYGAYNIDNGGYRMMGFSFEAPRLGTSPYRAAGLAHDYTGMPHIPWHRLRVLRSWDGR